MKIAPSILAADFGRLAEDVAEAEAAGADWIHVDVMDGRFVPEITIGPAVVEAVRRATSLPVDVHLMIEEPERHLARFAGAGADGITVHVETSPHLHRTIQQIRDLGARAGVALNPATSLETVREILPSIDLLLVMTVNPGFGGQAYIPGSTDRVRRASTLLGSLTGEGVELQVDGGIDADTIRDVATSGATVAVAGSAVFGHPSGIREAIRILKASMAKGAATG